ncbi:MAG: nucleotidyltransferase domain-containing protein [Leptospirales bacterium]|nr:nucleotidyltransferase domain-containing protein [Leptospirales bacterium]
MGNTYQVDEIRDMLFPVFSSEPIYRAILFGSYAKGEATDNSDIDIVIDSRGELHGLDFFAVLDGIVETLNKPVDLIEISEIKHDAPILEDIRQEGIVLYER